MRRISLQTRGYLLAILAAIAALLLRQLLSPLLGTDSPYLTTWAAIVVSAWYFGLGPSIVCVLISVLGVWYLLLPYFHSFSLQNPRTEVSGMVLFSVLSSLVVALGEANRRSKSRSELEVAHRQRVEDSLRSSKAELETRIQERTTELNVAVQNLSRETARVREHAEWLDAANDA